MLCRILRFGFGHNKLQERYIYRTHMSDKKIIDADVVAGTQMAMVAAIGALLKHVTNENPRVLKDFEAAVEHAKVALLSSEATDQKIAAFETVAQALIRIC